SDQRNVLFTRVADQSLEVLLITGHHNAKRFDLKDTGVGAGERTAQVVEKALAPDDSLQVIAYSLSLRFFQASRSPMGAAKWIGRCAVVLGEGAPGDSARR